MKTILIFAVGIAIALCLRWTWIRKKFVPASWMIRCGALAFLVASLLGCFGTVISNRLIFQDEPTVVSIAAAWFHGQPMYSVPSSGDVYGLLYGPFTYLLYLPPIWLHAIHVQPFLMWVAAAYCLSLVLTYVVARTLLSVTASFVAMAFFAANALFLPLNAWALKGDIWILLFGVMAFTAVTRWRGGAGWLVAAVCGGILIDLKATMVVVALVPLLYLYENRRNRLIIVSAVAVMGIIVVFPFFLRGVDGATYLHYLRNASGHGLSYTVLRYNLRQFLYLCAPVASILLVFYRANRTAFKQWARGRALFLAGVTLACVVALVTGSKFGAGPWHLLPLLPAMLVVGCDAWRTMAARTPPEQYADVVFRSGVPVAVVLIYAGIAAMSFVLTMKMHLNGPEGLSNVRPKTIEADLDAILAQHPGVPMQMGYGNNRDYDMSYLRPILQIKGSPLMIDADAFNEASLTGETVPAANLMAIRSCKIKIWLIPGHGEPFTLESYYSLDGSIPKTQMFPAAFTKAFRSSYTKTTSTKYFDLWECIPQAASQPKN